MTLSRIYEYKLIFLAKESMYDVDLGVERRRLTFLGSFPLPFEKSSDPYLGFYTNVYKGKSRIPITFSDFDISTWWDRTVRLWGPKRIYLLESASAGALSLASVVKVQMAELQKEYIYM